MSLFQRFTNVLIVEARSAVKKVTAQLENIGNPEPMAPLNSEPEEASKPTLPPSREFRETMFGFKETKKSQQEHQPREAQMKFRSENRAQNTAGPKDEPQITVQNAHNWDNSQIPKVVRTMGPKK